MKQISLTIKIFTMANCNCPASSSLGTIPNQDCPVDFEQLQKFVFQRAGFLFDPEAATPQDITKKADWTALKAANDATKVVVTPLIGGDPIITPGDPITTGGGDNSTLNGTEEVLGTNPSAFTGVFKSLSSAVKKAMKVLECETDLVVYFVNNNNKIIANEISDGVYTGFPITSFHLSDRNNAGFGTKDTFNVRFSLAARWDDNAAIIEPEAGFRPLQDL